MTVKEMEERSGITRANIRYYEEQGLLQPQRQPNGYRDYSQEDLDTLLRIKLLRALQVSLEEIKALQQGETQLGDTLAKKLEQLQQDSQSLLQLQEICRAMQAEQAAYATLDADKYLNGNYQGAQEDRTPAWPPPPAEVLPHAFYPWRRFLARGLDATLYAMLWWSVLAFGFGVNPTQRSGIAALLDTAAGLLLMLLLEPLWLRFCGTTPGKWIFGLRLEERNGRKPSFVAGFIRTGGVLIIGLGCSIPFLALYTLWKSYKRCTNLEPQPWDGELDYYLVERRWFVPLYLVAHCALFALSFSLLMLAAWPPNRGPLTVAEFSQNYNAMTKYYGVQTRYYLDEKGQWSYNSPEDTSYSPEYFNPTKPRFTFETRDGEIIGLTMEVEDVGRAGAINYDTEMLLAMLSYLGAQRGQFLLDNYSRSIAIQIANHSFESFSFEMAGVTVDCTTQHQGFHEMNDMLIYMQSGYGKYQLKLTMAQKG